MANEEEEQKSAMLSDEDVEYETAVETSTINAMESNKVEGKETDKETALDNGAMEVDDQDASGEELDQDAEGEEDNDYLLHQQITVGECQKNEPSPIKEEEDVDASGEEDDKDDKEDEDEEDEEEQEQGPDDEEDEEVGAVKLKPGESDEDDVEDDDARSEDSSLPSAPDESDEEAPWEEGEGAEDDDESEAAPSNNCMFCKQDEENDPSEEFEAFLGCARCGENAHQQCARDVAAMSEDNTPQNWRCPDCFSGESDSEDQAEDEEMQDAPLTSQLSEPMDEVVDSQPPELDEDDSDSQSVLNEGTTNEDGTRLLRKRKTSSVELDDNIISLRKRRRNQSTEPASPHEDALDTGNSTETTRQQRTLRLKVTRPPPVTVEKKTRTALIMKIKVKPGNLKEILSRRRRDRRRPPSSATRAPRPTATPRNNPPPIPLAMLQTPFTTDSYSQPFYSFFDRDSEGMNGKPYGGILSDGEADTSKTFPTPEDRRKFDQAKQKAEDEWRARVLAMQAEADVPVRKPKKANENASQIECIEFGGWEIDTWYAAPYPAEYSRNRVLYICEFCLKYMNSDYVAWRHKLKCPAKHPPGDEIYRHGSISVFEVDGRKNPVYCQNLCLLAKLFLGSKTLYYDVEPFLFYVLCEYDDCGYHFVGYFSKEKRSSSQNNVSCILTLPIHQRKGYGNLLIDFSYLLTRAEEKTGSPEKPLSDMGLVSYRNYWRLILCRYFLDVMENEDYKKQGLSIKRISEDTGMTADDVISALEGLRALVRDPQTKLYAFRVDLDYCRQYVGKWEAKGYVKLKPEALAWTPYVMGRCNAVNFELGPPINTIAPREDGEAKIQEGPNTVGEESQPLLNSEKLPASDSGVELKMESAESNGESPEEPVRSIENVPPEEKGSSSLQNGEAQDSGVEDVLAWTLPYRDVPASRFEIFPPVAGGRKADRSRQGAGRPAVPRTASSSSKRPKRSGGSSRRPTASRPKSTSKRKTGGTGRGPGRWPKGTKKSDYGNADSGPGLPPGWKEKQARSKAAEENHEQNPNPADVQVALDDLAAEDSVFVSTAVETNGDTAGEEAEEAVEEEAEEIEEEAEDDAEEDVEEDADEDAEEELEEIEEIEEENDQDASGDEIEPERHEAIIEEDVDAEGEDA